MKKFPFAVVLSVCAFAASARAADGDDVDTDVDYSDPYAVTEALRDASPKARAEIRQAIADQKKALLGDVSPETIKKLSVELENTKAEYAAVQDIKTKALTAIDTPDKLKTLYDQALTDPKTQEQVKQLFANAATLKGTSESVNISTSLGAQSPVKLVTKLAVNDKGQVMMTHHLESSPELYNNFSDKVTTKLKTDDIEAFIAKDLNSLLDDKSLQVQPADGEDPVAAVKRALAKSNDVALSGSQDGKPAALKSAVRSLSESLDPKTGTRVGELRDRIQSEGLTPDKKEQLRGLQASDKAFNYLSTNKADANLSTCEVLGKMKSIAVKDLPISTQQKCADFVKADKAEKAAHKSSKDKEDDKANSNEKLAKAAADAQANGLLPDSMAGFVQAACNAAAKNQMGAVGYGNQQFGQMSNILDQMMASGMSPSTTFSCVIGNQAGIMNMNTNPGVYQAQANAQAMTSMMGGDFTMPGDTESCVADKFKNTPNTKEGMAALKKEYEALYKLNAQYGQRLAMLASDPNTMFNPQAQMEIQRYSIYQATAQSLMRQFSAEMDTRRASNPQLQDIRAGAGAAGIGLTPAVVPNTGARRAPSRGSGIPANTQNAARTNRSF
ncbi:MAG: hypothetical protein JST16_13180 [Bdellovibrionales bacterium]|nr:hypothetical protein [Bdellovibrionales bacterium]